MTDSRHLVWYIDGSLIRQKSGFRVYSSSPKTGMCVSLESYCIVLQSEIIAVLSCANLTKHYFYKHLLIQSGCPQISWFNSNFIKVCVGMFMKPLQTYSMVAKWSREEHCRQRLNYFRQTIAKILVRAPVPDSLAGWWVRVDVLLSNITRKHLLLLFTGSEMNRFTL